MRYLTERKVILGMPLGSASGRERLTGIFKYLAEGHRWNVHLVQESSALTCASIAEAVNNGVEGFIVGLVVSRDVERCLLDSGLPVVFTLTPDAPARDLPPRCSYVRSDNRRIGQEAARYLQGLGTFRSFGYYSGLHKHYGWSRRREEGFCAELLQRGRAVSVLHDETIPPDPAALPHWLMSLEKPSAVFAGSDADGQALIEACVAAGISVPSQIAVIGVENDEYLCNCSRPTLSSIQPRNQEIGYRAAEELENIIGGKGGGHIVLKNPVEKFVERESTRVLPPAGHLIRDALAYIHENACSGLRASDVSKHLHVSRRLLDLRFRQIQKETVLEAIVGVRIAEAKRKLEYTRDSIAEIAASCGCKSQVRFAKIFKRETGMTMTAWRKARRP